MARKRQTKNGIFSKFDFIESYTSLIVGAIVVLVIGILFLSFARGNRNMQTSSISEDQKMEQEGAGKTSSSYTIKAGDDLWSISENVYYDGYKWVEIANANKIENPGLIFVGDKLIIPKIEKEKTAIQSDKPTQESNKIMENNAITGTIYVIVEGDNLWNICVRAYGDGFRWVELAKVNNIQNPDLIYPDNVLNVPR